MNQPQLYSLTSAELKVVISDFGARLISAQYQGKELIYGPKSPDKIFADDCYCGAICGRVANRIAGGQFQMPDGRSYQLPINNGNNHLHGGLSGYSDKIWQLIKQSESEITLSYSSPDGEENYPGAIEIVATYRLIGNRLSLCMQASSDTDSIINLTNHVYWNLSGESDICQHILEVAADRFTPINDNIPTGEILPVADSPFDLRSPVILGDRIGQDKTLPLGYDDNYCLPSIQQPQVKLRISGCQLSLWTDAPGLQVYTGYYLPDCFGGVALEAQSYPDSPNQPLFPSILIEAGKAYERNIVWEIQ